MVTLKLDEQEISILILALGSVLEYIINDYKENQESYSLEDLALINSVIEKAENLLSKLEIPLNTDNSISRPVW